jgi:hypothetical protein
MNKMRCTRAARRLGCYLHTIGVRLAMENMTNRERYRLLLSTYSTLPKELRREARRRGRRIIREVGLIEATQHAYPTCAIAPTIQLTQAERAEQMAALMRQSLGRCASCSSWSHPKRAWPTRELAEAFRPFAGDMSLQCYECPVDSGSYHLGHRSEAASSLSRTAESTDV